MTYTAEVQFKFDATYTPTYTGGFGSTIVDDFIPEEHYVITAPAADLNANQYFKLFEKFMLCVGMCPQSIRSGAMSLVFNDYVNEAEQRKVCAEYELTMDEDLRSKFEDFKKLEEDWANLRKGPMGTVIGDEDDKKDWETLYHKLYHRFKRFIKFTDSQLEEIVDNYEKEKSREYNLKEAGYLDKRAELDLKISSEVGSHETNVGIQSTSNDDWNEFWEGK